MKFFTLLFLCCPMIAVAQPKAYPPTSPHVQPKNVIPAEEWIMPYQSESEESEWFQGQIDLREQQAQREREREAEQHEQETEAARREEEHREKEAQEEKQREERAKEEEERQRWRDELRQEEQERQEELRRRAQPF